MIVLPDGENRMIVASFVSTKYRNVTERQTDGQTRPWHIQHWHSKLCRRAVKMNMFSNETCLNVKHQYFIFQHIVQIYLNTYLIYKQVSECLQQKMMLAAVQATDEQLIAPLYLM